MAEGAYLTIRNLTKKFGDFVALNDISLDVNEGEFVCFLGPSGCGKTTLLRAIAGLDIQTFGSMSQGGRDISALPPDERDFGIVFQSYALFPNLTIAKNVAYGLENRGQSRQEITARVQELLELVGLADQGAKYPAQLSGGQQQRIALARAIAPSPGLLLLDEPLSALDAKVRTYLRHEIRDLHNRLGVTTIMVTHDQEEALTMADRIVVMNHGVIDQIGTPEDIYNRPRTRFVADFIGTMNFLEGVVADGRIKIGQAQLAFSESDPRPGAAIMAIRPEDIEIRESGEGENVLKVQVEEREFLGSFSRLKLSSPVLAPQSLVCDLAVSRMRGVMLEPGSVLSIVLPKAHLHVYRAGD